MSDEPKNRTRVCRKCKGPVVVADEEGVAAMAICINCRSKADAETAGVEGMGVSRIPGWKPHDEGRVNVAISRPMDLKKMRKIQDAVRVIRESAEYDGKTRTEMALKLAEEVGELAREVLRHEKADGTRYRGEPPREKLVEEMTDVMIVLFALIEKYGVPDEALVLKARAKIKKWMEVIGDKT